MSTSAVWATPLPCATVCAGRIVEQRKSTTVDRCFINSYPRWRNLDREQINTRAVILLTSPTLRHHPGVSVRLKKLDRAGTTIHGARAVTSRIDPSPGFPPEALRISVTSM